jgi:4-aminobutyrate aminotransferase / (S)-3-amino-2-methylpropionate transaminase / 5-aminovalerate transaminase
MSGYSFSRKPIAVPLVKTKNRLIQTHIPAPGTEDILAKLDNYESRSMQGTVPLVWEHAQGFNIFDQKGNKWIDFTSTIFVANIGHSNPRLVKAIREVLDNNLVHHFTYPSQLRAQYYEKLIQFTDGEFDKAFLLSGGTEATEAALKLMRMNGQRIGKKRLGVICMEGSFHGRTLGAQLLGGIKAQKEWIGFNDEDIFHIGFPYPWVLEEGASPEEFLKNELTKLEDSGVCLETDVCGVMLETFQGWPSLFYPKEFIKAMEAFCWEKKILLAMDEVQAGFGRTGTKFGYQHYDIHPDLICCGKGMGSGVALSGVLGKREIMDIPDVGMMSSTHSANPIACAGGLATLEEILENDLVEEARRKGVLLHDGLNSLKEKNPERIPYIFGKGLIASVLFKNPETGEADPAFASRVSESCMQKGLLVVHTGREAVKIGPPLTISDDALLEGLDVLDEAITESA